MNKKTILVVAILVSAIFVKAQTTKTDSVKTKLGSQLDSASYAMGSAIAKDLKSRSLTHINYDLFVQAMQDVFKGITPALSMEQGQQAIMACFADVKKKASEPLVAEATRFLAENKKRKGVIVTASGLQYEILKSTQAPKPKATDEVTVHYKGTLTNGKQFDSSYDRKEPAKFPLNQVIPGWTEGVQLMTLGSKFRFYLPYQLGYGENGAGADIPPYSVLIFEIELLKIGN
ncbi:MAG: FKBP-type peptidyl-prolyl cis-trans isomerase [Sphingobacteriaceae bacterium]